MAIMERQVDAQMDELKKMILSMGGHVEKALEIAIQALIERNPNRFNQVHEIEDQINADHIHVDEACLQFMAKQGPKARDLRLIFSMVKINADLERMGDQCVNIAFTGKDFLNNGGAYSLQLIEEMSTIVRRMVKESLDSFVREDVELSKKILLMDDEVDTRKQRVFQDLSAEIKKNPSSVESALDLILIARNLERLGDHATNIAEDVIFVSTGKDIRHGGKFG
jgi:phosphate transport system protein